ncbi:hypothetical protein SDC9_100324 [bioreactor metagenome]|uniref:Uncharacterized protein n=1 Tax=bioreactor metagenome TaxID=1076179 RepID=A0A645AKU6_9ZZZZ
MQEAPHAKGLQPAAEGLGGHLPLPAGDDHAANVKPEGMEAVDQAEHVFIVRDAQIPPNFILLDVSRRDGDDDFHVGCQLLEHPHLTVRRKARQHPGGMIVVKQLAAKFQIQLSSKIADPTANML